MRVPHEIINQVIEDMLRLPEPEVECEREVGFGWTLLTIKLRVDEEELRLMDTPEFQRLIQELLLKCERRIVEQFEKAIQPS